ncbi:MAG: hypothetical protein JRM82_04925, partial [Nitrososphaerota archaeon]|nr:hypothetical protein [Nitrososphaerota archaeon]
MKILVFLQGTVLVEDNVSASTREESVMKSRELSRRGGPYGELVPIGDAVPKLKRWKERGAKIIYLTASREPENVKRSARALKDHGFPDGRL